MTDWRDQPATNNQLGTILHLLELHRPHMTSLDKVVREREAYKENPSDSILRMAYQGALEHYRILPFELYELALDRIKAQIKDPNTVYLTKGKASDIMGEIRNGYTADKFKELFL